MLSFKLQAWNALAPGLEDSSDWSRWLEQPVSLPAELHKVALKQIPPMLRRRFTELGRCAAGAALPLLEDVDGVPGVFASRHGDTPLTLSLLEGIAGDEPMSPTGFSLAVHNAVSGLLSIARKDVSEVTAIASVENLIPHALLEAVTQLQNSESVLCLIYDVPLPELYQPYTSCEPFPFALAMLLSRSEGVKMTLEQHSPQAIEADSSDLLRTMRCITGLDRDVHFPVCAEMGWKLSRDE
ncbi:beta-ketoacyl synthase chain length factor [Marinobacterium sp. BA1]|uniref:beta-ketoacyl synthase chain length factor n=1 Tax=Marinobacterium sp. BA1 TaxID=3138931 RepID=UPI0032E6DD86